MDCCWDELWSFLKRKIGVLGLLEENAQRNIFSAGVFVACVVFYNFRSAEFC